MNAFAHFPRTLHWNASELAAAVPPRLSELPLFVAADAAVHARAANARRRHAHGVASSRLPSSALPQRAGIR